MPDARVIPLDNRDENGRPRRLPSRRPRRDSESEVPIRERPRRRAAGTGPGMGQEMGQETGTSRGASREGGSARSATQSDLPLVGAMNGAGARARSRAAGADDPADSSNAASQSGPRTPDDWDRKVAEALAFLRRRITGDYPVDDFGFDPELNDHVLMALLRPLYYSWFRVDVRGVDHVPEAGGALIVANHSGTVALDSLMTQVALLDEHPAKRHLRMLGADFVFQLPFVGELARKGGTTLATNADAEALLNRGELVGVWPEGFKGVGKPFSERYKLQRFGRGGFVSAAIRTGVPIIPCSIVGAEEIFPMIGNLKTLARLLGMPYIPITPTFPWLGLLGLVPLPSKWIIQFGEPIITDQAGPAAAEDPMLVFDLTDRVRETIQHSLYTLLLQRRSVFF
jgi:1-acyl-sn-glycerol-3-phosphate acyltransferase